MIAFELLKGHLADALNEMFVDNVCYSLTGGNFGLAYTSEACIFVIHFLIRSVPGAMLSYAMHVLSI